MSVYKEIGFLVRKIENQSKRIFGDACDYGVPVYSVNDPIIGEIKGIMELYNIKVETCKYLTGATQTFKFEGGWPAVIEAGFEKATISFTTTRVHKNMIGYISVHTESSVKAIKRAREYND